MLNVLGSLLNQEPTWSRKTIRQSQSFFVRADRADRYKLWLKTRALSVEYSQLPLDVQRDCARNGGFWVCMDLALEATW